MKLIKILLLVFCPIFASAQSGAVAAQVSNLHRGYVDIPVITYVPRNYYISSDGVGDGLTSGSPAPVSVLMAATVHSRDSVYFNKGDTLLVTGLTISADSVGISSYGSGADPVIMGSELVTGSWTNEGGGLWSKTMDEPLWVYLNGVSATNAQSNWLTITVNTGPQVRRVTAATVNAYPESVVGAGLLVEEYNFRVSFGLEVSAYNSSTGDVTFTGDLEGGAAGLRLQFFNQKQFISVNGEWAYEGGKLYLKSASDPTGTDVRVCTQDFGFFSTGSEKLTVTGLEFQHYFKYAIRLKNSPYATITSCTITQCRGDGIRTGGQFNTDITITNDTISYCGLRGLHLGGTNGGYIANNEISEIGTDPNIGRPFDTNKHGGTAIVTLLQEQGATLQYSIDNTTIEKNEFHHLGYMGIALLGFDNIIKKNYIHDHMEYFHDGSGIYFYYANLIGFSSGSYGNLVEQNIIVDVSTVSGESAGVYVDNGSYDNTINNNFIFEAGHYGVIANFFSSKTIITNNIIAGSGLYEVWYREQAGGGSPYFDYPYNEDCELTDNIIVANTFAGRCVTLYNFNTNPSFNPFTSIDNNHYVQPYTGHMGLVSYGTIADKTLTDWRTYTGGDAAATIYTTYKTYAVGDVLGEANPTDSPVNFNIPAGYTDVYGNTPSNPYSIPAWGGLIYLKEP